MTRRDLLRTIAALPFVGVLASGRKPPKGPPNSVATAAAWWDGQPMTRATTTSNANVIITRFTLTKD